MLQDKLQPYSTKTRCEPAFVVHWPPSLSDLFSSPGQHGLLAPWRDGGGGGGGGETPPKNVGGARPIFLGLKIWILGGVST